MRSTRYRFFLTDKPCPVCLGHSGQVWRQREPASVNVWTAIAEECLHAAVSFPLTIPHTVRHKQRSLVKPPSSLSVSSRTHQTAISSQVPYARLFQHQMKVERCADWMLCCLNQPEPALFKPQCFNWNSAEDAGSSVPLCALLLLFFFF